LKNVSEECATMDLIRALDVANVSEECATMDPIRALDVNNVSEECATMHLIRAWDAISCLLELEMLCFVCWDMQH